MTSTSARASIVGPPALFPPRASRRARISRRRGYLLTAPALLVVALVTLAPIAFSVYLSLCAVTAGADGFDYSLVGLRNYAAALGSQALWSALTFTAVYTVVSVTVQVVLGLGVAIIIDRMTRGTGVVLALLLVPWAMITVVSGQLWSYIFNGVYGLADYLLVVLHVVPAPVTILSNPVGAFVALLVADSWKTIPFVSLILFGGLRTVDKELYAAARLDGAGGWTILGRITIPLIRQSLITAVVFRVLQAFGIFDLPFVLTNGGPGNATQSMAMLAYNALFQDLNIGYGAAISCITAAVVIVFAVVFLRAFKVEEPGG
ncbi:carbohydrate ABC transporter permease [Amnibacterium sp.]|uniref:carbohydrate ABC transporter permease n=1 Tax=Amnibacterium sp. TaxID=1872496 RepID=UPI0026092F4E|nr:sugar ABC transporter permease [Amnibacterium sp.]MCU1472051.1 carbohydrate transporter rane protein 1, family [Amnibacterium sp.]